MEDAIFSHSHPLPIGNMLDIAKPRPEQRDLLFDTGLVDVLAPLPADLLGEAVPGFEFDYLTRLQRVFIVVLIDFDYALSEIPSTQGGDLLRGDRAFRPRVLGPLDVHEVLGALAVFGFAGLLFNLSGRI